MTVFKWEYWIGCEKSKLIPELLPSILCSIGAALPPANMFLINNREANKNNIINEKREFLRPRGQLILLSHFGLRPSSKLIGAPSALRPHVPQ